MMRHAPYREKVFRYIGSEINRNGVSNHLLQIGFGTLKMKVGRKSLDSCSFQGC